MIKNKMILDINMFFPRMMHNIFRWATFTSIIRIHETDS